MYNPLSKTRPEFMWTLDPSSKKYTCPQCGKPKVFKRFVNSATLEYYHDERIGRCDREVNCGYFIKPQSKPEEFQTFIQQTYIPQAPKKPSFHPKSLLVQTLQGNEECLLMQFLKGKFSEADINRVKREYYIGNYSPREYETLFWQIDINGNIRGCKLMTYNPLTGKRIKGNGLGFNWMHSVLKLYEPKFELVQCYFGEHLLKIYPLKKVHIVESEKTALIGSLAYPEFIWLATGGSGGLKPTGRPEKIQALKGRDVILFPDLAKPNSKNNPFEKWSKIAKENGFKVSDYLEKIATPEDRENGSDIADFILKGLEDFIK
jgi:hypothetical protein